MNPCVVEELLEEGRKQKVEPRVELLLGEIYGVFPSLLCRTTPPSTN